MNSEIEGQRITLKRKRPNPLFQEWLEELTEEAKTKKSKLEPMLHEALNSLCKYPLPLRSGSECAILKGFDKKLCIFLDKRLDVYNNSKPAGIYIKGSDDKLECINSVSNSSQPVKVNTSEKITNTNKSQLVAHTYRPAFRSGSYAILLALREYSKENPSKLSLTKEQLIDKAQKFSEESFVRPNADSFYTAWSNINRLINKNLVKKTGGKRAEYSLTYEGLTLATSLLELYKDQATINDIIFNSVNSVSNNSQPSIPLTLSNNNLVSNLRSDATESNQIHMPAESFDIILLIDKHEISGTSRKNDPTVAQFNKYPDLKHEYRSLKVGDFTWIAQHRVHTDQELVLPYVIERKRMDDLAASIKDGRFHEQKFRLKKCGLKNVIYLIEDYGSNKVVGLPETSLTQALSNTRIQDGFKIHKTNSLTNSARFLAMMTKRLTIEYQGKSLIECNGNPTDERTLMTFKYFNKTSIKNKSLTVTDTFLKILLQLKGVSIGKALAITNVYKTPSSLIEAYRECNEQEGKLLLANLKFGEIERNVGPAVSKTFYELFFNKELF